MEYKVSNLLVNIDNICRVCLTENANSLSIFCQNETDEKYRDLLNKIQESGGIKITEDDGLPTLICSKCINNINIAFKIRQQCQRSDTLLRLYYKKLKESNLKTIHYQETLQPELLTQEISQSSQDLFNYLEIQSMDAEEVVVGHEEVPSVENAGMTDDEPPSYKLKLQLLEIGSTASNSPIINSQNNSRTKAQNKVYPEHLGTFESLSYDPVQVPNDRKYTCSICAQAFDSLKILRQHRKIHKDELYVCKICPVRCAKPEELAMHLKSHQLTQEAVAAIQINNHENSEDYNDYDMVDDQQRIDRYNEQLLRDKSPDPLDFTSDNKHSLVGYKNYSITNSMIKMLPSNSNNSSNNSNSNSSNSGIIHKCEICGQTFSKEKGLMRHRAYHESRVICDICGKVCSNKNWLASHKKLAHSGNTKSEKNTCSYCQKTFYFSAHLMSHLKRVHGTFS